MAERYPASSNSLAVQDPEAILNRGIERALYDTALEKLGNFYSFWGTPNAWRILEDSDGAITCDSTFLLAASLAPYMAIACQYRPEGSTKGYGNTTVSTNVLMTNLGMTTSPDKAMLQFTLREKPAGKPTAQTIFANIPLDRSYGTTVEAFATNYHVGAGTIKPYDNDAIAQIKYINTVHALVTTILDAATAPA